MGAPRYETKAELALRILRERILIGELTAGQKLDINEVAVELGMSATPIREAMKALQADRLVEYTPHRGTIVATNSTEVAAEVFRLRLLLEPAAVAATIQRMDEPLLEKLERLHDGVMSADQERSDGYPERDAEWHWALYQAAGSPFLADFIHRLWDAFPWRALASMAQRRKAAVGEHELIMGAIRERDVEAGVRHMRRHVESSRRTLRLPGGPAGDPLGATMAAAFSGLERERDSGD